MAFAPVVAAEVARVGFAAAGFFAAAFFGAIRFGAAFFGAAFFGAGFFAETFFGAAFFGATFLAALFVRETFLGAGFLAAGFLGADRAVVFLATGFLAAVFFDVLEAEPEDRFDDAAVRERPGEAERFEAAARDAAAVGRLAPDRVVASGISSSEVPPGGSARVEGGGRVPPARGTINHSCRSRL